MAHTPEPERPLHQRSVAPPTRPTEEGLQKEGEDHEEFSYRQQNEGEQAQQSLHDRQPDYEAGREYDRADDRAERRDMQSQRPLDQPRRRSSSSAHPQSGYRSAVTPPPNILAAPSSSSSTSMRAPLPAASISMPPPPLSLPGPTSGATAGSHRESFSRTPVRGSLQSRTALSENDVAEYVPSHAHEQQPLAARPQSSDQASPSTQSHTQLQTLAQLPPQQAQFNDAAAPLDPMAHSALSSARTGAVNVMPRSSTSASPRSKSHARQYNDRTRREQAMDYGPGRGHSESYTKLWRDYHNSHEDIPSKHASAGAPGSTTVISAQTGEYEIGHRRANDHDYQGATSSAQSHQQQEPQQYPDPRVSSSATSLHHGLLSHGTDYDHHEEDEGDHDQDNIEEYERPQIWTAVYSNVSVYETIVNSIAVMRRRTDSWLNATQILKVAGVPKARRTKILQALEREVDPSKHEKVQGGYGKYQGTWVEFERGREICREWGVENLLRPLLELNGEKWDGYNEAYGYPYTQGFAAGFPTKHVKDQHAQQQQRRSYSQPPTKEEVMALQRKRIYKGLDQPGTASPTGPNGGNGAPRFFSGGTVSNRGGYPSPGVAGAETGVSPQYALASPSAASAGSSGGNQTYFQSISSTAASAVSAMNKARFDTSLKNRSGSSELPQGQQQAAQPQLQLHLQSQPQQQLLHRRSQSQNLMPPPETSSSTAAQLAEIPDEINLGGPPRKRLRSDGEIHDSPINAFSTPKLPNRVSFVSGTTPVKNSENIMPPPAVPASASATAASAGEPNMFYRTAQVDGAAEYTATSSNAQIRTSLPSTSTVIRGLPHLPPATTPDRYKKMKLVMTLFLDKKIKDFSDHPAILTLDPIDLEIPLDEHLNTALHWASMLARMPLITALMKKGVSIFRLNGNGETALHKAVGTRNNLDYRSFGKLLQILAPTIEVIDGTGRNLLHHICIMAATGGGGHVAARHYLETLLEFLVKQGGKQLSPPTSSAAARSQANGMGRNAENREIITLGKFMATMVNVQDDNGDTPLNIAGRANASLVPQLIELGADAWIPNHSGLKPADYGVGVDLAGKLKRSMDEDGDVRSQSQRGSSGVASGIPVTDHDPGTAGHGSSGSITYPYGEASDERALRQGRKAEVRDAAIQEINTLLHNHIEEYTQALTLKTSHQHAETRQWHERIRESAKARQAEQEMLAELTWRQRRRLELERRIRNLEGATRVLMKDSKPDDQGDPSNRMSIDGKEDDDTKNFTHRQPTRKVGSADGVIGIDMSRFKEVFPDGLAALSAAAEQLAPLNTATPSQAQQQQQQETAAVPAAPSESLQSQHTSESAPSALPPPPPPPSNTNIISSTAFTPSQKAYLSTLPSPAILKRVVAAYTANNQHLTAEIDALKTKNIALGDIYRRIVMACTGWTAKQVDEAAEGLTECVREINDSPVPEEEAIEILMRERGQDW